MSTEKKTTITLKTTVNAPVEKVWDIWTKPEHIVKWTSASDDWHTPRAENDLRTGGKFLSRMEAKDGSFGFDFGGVYDKVEHLKTINYTLGDQRKVEISFASNGQSTEIIETFEAEDTNPVEMQRDGWKAILTNFKKYTEAHN
ncbi:polyketide cyclase [Pedobacter sp. HMWF019]|uniref:SRPBCC family protein n=1 Tax=Pedobacter sp. HMWF019 TaxID=2056856 RepID=UPI000D39FB9F|nr:SRPBCC family protein [Pedobacter sp. HMWF019]PTT03870.1 polyketide cyclase [Pedobacter sp. HMWF019]